MFRLYSTKLFLPGPLSRVLLCLLVAMNYLSAQQLDSISVDGQFRHFYLHLPIAYQQTSISMPLVIGLHGANQSAYVRPASFAAMTDWDSFSDSLSFIVVYPVGKGSDIINLSTWNAGKCCPPASSAKNRDVAFISSLIDSLSMRYRVNTRRVYATGFSNGAIMCYRLAYELSQKITAIAPHSGALMIDVPARPPRAVPLLHIHSKLDSVVPYAGGVGRLSSSFAFPSVDSTLLLWRGLLGCDELPQILFSTPLARAYKWSPCQDQTQVQLYATEDGRHWWTGSPIAQSSQAFSATAVIWDFFEKFSLTPTSSVEQQQQKNDDELEFRVSSCIDRAEILIYFCCQKSQYQKLALYNSIGQCVQSLYDDVASAGRYQFSIQTTNLGSGPYYVILTGPHNISTRLVTVEH